MNREEYEIKETKKNYKVYTIDGEEVSIDKEVVNEIVMRTGANEEEVVILLATIEIAGVTRGSRYYTDIEEHILTESIPILMTVYSPQDLTRIFEEFKYCEIKKILEDDNPISNLGNML